MTAKRWDDLTLAQQLQHAGWIRVDAGLQDRATGELIPGRIGLTAKWVRWLADHPERAQEAKAAWRASTLAWYPRPGDLVWYAQQDPKTSTYRVSCSGSVVRVLATVDQLVQGDPADPDSPPVYRPSHRVEGLYSGFGRAQPVRWLAYQGELRPATSEELAGSQLAQMAGGGL